MTPWQEEGTAGVSWTYDEIICNMKKPPHERREIWIAPFIKMSDCPTMTKKALEEWLKVPMTKEERQARFYGRHVARSGKILGLFRDYFYDEKKWGQCGHVLPKDFPLNPEWTRILLMDPASPQGTTAVIWLAITTPGWWQGVFFKQNEYYVYKEYKEKDLTVPDNSTNIKFLMGGEKMDQLLMDGRWMNQPADADVQGETYGTKYSRCGLDFSSWGANEIPAEIDAVKEYLQGTLQRAKTAPGLFINESCYKLLDEIEHYIYPVHKTGDLKGVRKLQQAKKQKNIHLVDALKAACNLRLTWTKRYYPPPSNSVPMEVDPITGF